MTPAPAAPGVLLPAFGRGYVSGGGAAQAALPAEEGAAAALEAASAAAASQWEGTVEKVHYHSAQTSYSVVRVALRPEAPAVPPGAGGRTRRRVVTAVGNLPRLAVGQGVRLAGEWAQHPQYGHQLRVSGLEELPPGSNADMVAYLSGGVIPGVGPATAQRMVAAFEGGVEAVLDGDDAAARLAEGAGIGARTAAKIKAGWDEGRWAREGSRFLRDAGVPAALAQRVAQQLGARTREAVARDPYAALGALGLPLAKADRVAALVGAPADLVSRAAAAMAQSLKAAAKAGHTHLPWARLEGECREVLAELGKQHGARRQEGVFRRRRPPRR
jgi:exodeoxyribonuclease V alpha subunit